MPKQDELSQLEEEFRSRKESGEWEMHALSCENPFAVPPWRPLARCLARARATLNNTTIEGCAREIFADLSQVELDLHHRQKEERFRSDRIQLEFSRMREDLWGPDINLREDFVRYVKSERAQDSARAPIEHPEKREGIEIKRGPKPITRAEALFVAQVIERIGPNWRSKPNDVGFALDHGICDAPDPEECGLTDHERVTLPRGWREKGHDWMSPPDETGLIKAIEVRLKRAREFGH